MRAQRMKVFGGLVFRGKQQVRTIVAATSQAKAAEAVGATLSGFRDWWVESGNKDELAVALAKPGQVFQASSSMSKDFRPVVRIGGSWVDAETPIPAPNDSN
jgi:hypothetical protein